MSKIADFVEQYIFTILIIQNIFAATFWSLTYSTWEFHF